MVHGCMLGDKRDSWTLQGLQAKDPVTTETTKTHVVIRRLGEPSPMGNRYIVNLLIRRLLLTFYDGFFLTQARLSRLSVADDGTHVYLGRTS